MGLKYKPWPSSARPAALRLLRRPDYAPSNNLIRQLWAAVSLPQVALDVIAKNDDAAACSVEKAGRVLVYAANLAAQGRGVKQGMTVSAATALCPELAVYPRRPELERLALERLAQALYGFSALVNINNENKAVGPVLLLELKGSLDLFGGVDALLLSLREEIRRHTAHFFLAVAPTASAARLLALAGDEQPLLQTSDIAGRLAYVSLEHIAAFDVALLSRLEKLGIQHFGELIRLPQAGLRKRFGGGLSDYLQVLQGRQSELVEAWQPPQSYEANQNLMDELSDSAQLLPALSEMLADFCVWLQQRSARVQSFEFALFGYRQCISRFEVAFLRPNNRVEPMQKLLALRLEREVLAAPVVALSLTVTQLIYPKAMQQGQYSLWEGEQAASDSWWETLESIQTKLGAQSVLALECRDEHRPEQAWQWRLPGEFKQAAPSGESLGDSLERPLWLYEQARCLNNSEQKQLARCSRPERIASGWWDRDAVYRDYFVAQLHGRKLWVFRDASAEQVSWYCHGAFY